MWFQIFTFVSKWTKGVSRRGSRISRHGRMARGGHGRPNVSLGLIMPYPSTPCRQPPLKRPYSPVTALPLFHGWPPAGRASCGRPSYCPLALPCLESPSTHASDVRDYPIVSCSTAAESREKTHPVDHQWGKGKDGSC
jgi:hypothetical protein